MNLKLSLLLLLSLSAAIIQAQKSLSGFPKLSTEQLNLNKVNFDTDANAVIFSRTRFFKYY